MAFIVPKLEQKMAFGLVLTFDLAEEYAGFSSADRSAYTVLDSVCCIPLN